MKAIAAIGIGRAGKYAFGEFLRILFALCIFPPCRVALLRILGAKVGRNTVIHAFDFINYYRGSFRNLNIGDDCFVGNHVLFDLADRIEIDRQVTLSERVSIITHINVGYKDHPLQEKFPPDQKPVIIGKGSFAGVNATILHGVTLGERSFVAAGAVVTRSFDPGSMIGGVPADLLKK